MMALGLFFALAVPTTVFASMDVGDPSDFQSNFMDPLRSALAQAGSGPDESKVSSSSDGHAAPNTARQPEAVSHLQSKDKSDETKNSMPSLSEYRARVTDNADMAEGRMPDTEALYSRTGGTPWMNRLRNLGIGEESKRGRSEQHDTASSSWLQVQYHGDVDTPVSSNHKFLARQHPAAYSAVPKRHHHHASALEKNRHENKKRPAQQLLNVGRRAHSRARQPKNATAEDEEPQPWTWQQIVVAVIALIALFAICARLSVGYKSFMAEAGPAVPAQQAAPVVQRPMPERQMPARAASASALQTQIVGEDIRVHADPFATHLESSSQVRRANTMPNVVQETRLPETLPDERVERVEVQRPPQQELLFQTLNSLQVYVWMLVFTLCCFALYCSFGHMEGLWKQSMGFGFMVTIPAILLCCAVDFGTGATHRKVLETEKKMREHRLEWERSKQKKRGTGCC